MTCPTQVVPNEGTDMTIARNYVLRPMILVGGVLLGYLYVLNI